MSILNRINKIILSVFLAIMLSGALFSSHQVRAAQQLTDQDVSDAVEEKIRLDGVVPVDRIDVNTIVGVVTLSGTVDTILAKERAHVKALRVRRNSTYLTETNHERSSGWMGL